MNNAHIIIVGKSASGKEFLKDKMEKRGMLPDVSFTDRAPRDGEIPGKTYKFIPREEFEDMEDQGAFIQYDESTSGHFYGTLKSEWDTKQVFIMSPGGIAKLSPENRAEAFIIYLDIAYGVRKNRMAERGWNDQEIDERMKSDAAQFQEFTDFDIRISDPEF